jgi:uncharacterized GH25 family protein
MGKISYFKFNYLPKIQISIMKLKSNLFALAFIGISSLSGSGAYAHHVWLNATQYSLESPKPAEKAKTTLTFGWGDLFPLHDFLKPEQIQRFSLRSPQGQEQILQPGVGGFQATAIELDSNGTYIATTELTPRISTSIIENGKPKSIPVGRNEIPSGTKIIDSKQVLQFAKAILNVGIFNNQSVSVAIGRGLELVPMVNPVQLKEGDYLTLKVYINGKPLSRPYFYGSPQLEATYLGFSGNGSNALTLEVEGDGMVKMRIQRYGIWQVYATFTEPAPPELAAKVDKVEYRSSLTFEIK